MPHATRIPAGRCVNHSAVVAGWFAPDQESSTGWSFWCDRGCYFRVAKSRIDILKIIASAARNTVTP